MQALRLLPLLALAAAVAVAASGFGARFGLWDWRAGFGILRWGAYAGLAIATLAVVVAVVRRARAGATRWLAAAVAIGIAAAAFPLYWLHVARSAVCSTTRLWRRARGHRRRRCCNLTWTS